MINYFDHGGLYDIDNAQVFDDLDYGTRGTQYASMLSPFKKKKDGRGAYLSLKSQFTGAALWDAVASEMNEFLMNAKFTGQGNFSLKSYLNKHRNCYVRLERAAEHVQCQLPTQRTRVGYLLKNIEVEDGGLHAALAGIEMDDTPTGLRNNFEDAVALLIPKDPVAKKKKASKRPGASISATEATGGNSNGKPSKISKTGGLKVGRGKSGVDFRYHVPKEYAKLSKEQKKELKEWRDNNKSGGKVSAVTIRSEVAAVLKEERAKEERKQKEVSDVRAILSTLIASAAGTQPSAATAAVSSTTASGKVKFADTGTSVNITGSPQSIDPAQAEVAAIKLQALFGKKSAGGRKSAKKSGGH
jgi:hypothetical protein